MTDALDARQTFTLMWKRAGLESLTATISAVDTLLPPVPDTDGAADTAYVEALPRLTRASDAGAPPELAIGDTIGEGGMGVVRSARQLSLGREVAVKTLRGGENRPASTRKLLHEALVTGLLEHPNIVPVYALGRSDDGAPMMVMKRIEGTVWSDVLADPAHPLLRDDPREPIEWHLGVLVAVCNAVHYAHSKGILHRDLKPDNVMIGLFGEVYVLDWGIAVALQDDGTGALPLAADTDTIVGTVGYMAPEMVEARGSLLSERTDVFLLGALLHHILTGKPRYTGSQIFELIFAAYQAEEYQYTNETPANLAAVCRRATARVPADRYPSADALRHALAEVLHHRSSTRLSDRAIARLTELDDLIDACTALEADAGDPGARDSVLRLYDVSGEARFGLREALRTWPGNEDARAGLQRLLVRMAGYELDRGDERAAAVLIGELPTPSAELSDRLEVLRRRDAERAIEIARLERFGRDNDPSIGARTRAFLAMTLGVVWTALPLSVRWIEDTTGMAYDHAVSLWSSGLFASFILTGVWWARVSLFGSRINRSIVRSALVAVFGGFVMRVLCWWIDMPIGRVPALDMAVYGIVVAMMGAALSKRLFVPALVFFGGALAGVALPEYVFEVLAATNLIALTLIAVAWRPVTGDPIARVVSSSRPSHEWHWDAPE